MQPTPNLTLPRFVVFEGIDGVGKTTLANMLANYYHTVAPKMPLFADAFPGSRPGTLGEWVYRLHHGTAKDAPNVQTIDPMALQFLHIAAHVDAMRTHILPALADPAGGAVILDRFWWSSYAYSRPKLSREVVLAMVEAERMLWRTIPSPIIIYLVRAKSLKPTEINPAQYQELAEYYHEVVAMEAAIGTQVHTINNQGSLDELWIQLRDVLHLDTLGGSQ